VCVLIIGVILLAACQSLLPPPTEGSGFTASKYQAQFYVTEVPDADYPETKTRTVSGTVHGWFACTNGASSVPPLVWLVSKDGRFEYKDYQVREFVFKGVRQGAYNLYVGCHMVSPAFTHEIHVGKGDLVIEIELPFETLAEVYEEFGCLDCPPSPTP
jgi:hypothetical protein